MHDITDFESRGLPSVFVASNEFEGAAKAQGRSLGFDPERVLVQHPIQDRTDGEMRALADRAMPELVAALCSSTGAPG